MGNGRKSKRRNSLDASVDLISDLPRGVIDRIMEYVPLRDAARMSILSHKWRDIWTTTPQLVFDAQFFSTVIKNRTKTYYFYRIVSKILFQHEGPIVKFSLNVPLDQNCPGVAEWVSFLSRCNIKDFSVQNHSGSLIHLSSHLFSCAMLEKLNLKECILSNTNFKGFKKLVSLKLVNVIFGVGALEHLITSCPLLENLSLETCLSNEPVNIDARNLKHLIVVGRLKSIHIRNAANLMSASITAQTLDGNWDKITLRNLIDFFANSTKLDKLCLGVQFSKALFKDSVLCKTFESPRSLKLSCIFLEHLDEFASTVKAMQTCPNIEELDISVLRSKNLHDKMLDYNLDVTLSHLRCAKVSLAIASDVELKLIEFLLACSPVLEILSLTFIRQISRSNQLKMLKQLSRFRRASPKVEVICADPKICSDSGSSSSDSGSSCSDSDRYSVSSSDSDRHSVSSSDSDRYSVSSSDSGTSSSSDSG